MTTNDLNTLVARMRTALGSILPSSAEDIANAPWYSEDPTEQDLGDYVRLAAQAIGIDNVVIAAGYPDSAITSIANMLKGQDDAISAGMSGDNWTYTANFCYDDGNQAAGSPRAERAKIVYAPKPPVRPTGSLSSVFRDCTSLMGIDPDIATDPQTGWQSVTSLDYAFSGSTILPTTEIRLDIPQCINIGTFGGNFRKIVFINCRMLGAISVFQYYNLFLEEIEGWNLAQVTSASQPLPNIASALKDITFDGLSINEETGAAVWAGRNNTPYYCDATDSDAVNYIRSGLVLGRTTTGGSSNIARCSNLTAETLLMLVYMAYDWGTQQDPHNPLGLTRLTAETDAMLTYDFTSAQKGALHDAYQNINVRRILVDKGWVDIDPNGDYWTL